ncbi:MAG: hypothetical protein U5N55_03505 [Cypionkella sp.]|nr:hypothetical protein [Cypionkella sp.]
MLELVKTQLFGLPVPSAPGAFTTEAQECGVAVAEQTSDYLLTAGFNAAEHAHVTVRKSAAGLPDQLAGHQRQFIGQR